jgi:hypothetical protein
LVSRFVEPGTDTGEGSPAASDDHRSVCQSAPPAHWPAPEVLRILKQKPLSVAPGVVEAASDHIRALTVRIRLVNQQLRAAYRKLGELCDQLIPPEDPLQRQNLRRRPPLCLQ